jgi:hypothetical protein
MQTLNDGDLVPLSFDFVRSEGDGMLKNVDWMWPVSNWRHLELELHAFSLDKTGPPTMNVLLKNVDWIWPVSNWRHLELDFHAFSLDKQVLQL